MSCAKSSDKPSGTCHRFALKAGGVEGFFAQLGFSVTLRTLRLLVTRFRRHSPNCTCRNRPRLNDKSHLDVVFLIRGEGMGRDRRSMQMATVWTFFWEIFRSVKAAKRFLQRLAVHFGKPRMITMDKIERDIKAIKQLSWDAYNRAYNGVTTAIKVLHRPPCKVVRPVQFTPPSTADLSSTGSGQSYLPPPPLT